LINRVSALALLGLIAVGAHAQTYTALYKFDGYPDGSNPLAGVVLNSTTGTLYGTTSYNGSFRRTGIVFSLNAAGDESVVRNFGYWNGAYPTAPLVSDAEGNLYGTTYYGGALENEAGNGTVFKLGEGSPLHSFTGSPDGANPYAGVIVDSAGNLYGTTLYGGAYGKGTVFEVDSAGVETVLYSFTGGPDGGEPYGNLVMDATGILYGTTILYGAYGYGTVFKLVPSGAERVLHSFTGGADGGWPTAGLILDAAGNLYGTTTIGGARYGTVFKLDSRGAATVLHTFTGSPDGNSPFAGLVMDVAGNLYGTTLYGGNSSYCGCGTVFEIDAAGKETVLHTFTGEIDGAYPEGGLILDSAGNLYGTTESGGYHFDLGGGDGVVFKITP
jgi:uncharacterized repeat protein (TIGR03803 family)